MSKRNGGLSSLFFSAPPLFRLPTSSFSSNRQKTKENKKNFYLINSKTGVKHLSQVARANFLSLSSLSLSQCSHCPPIHANNTSLTTLNEKNKRRRKSNPLLSSTSSCSLLGIHEDGKKAKKKNVERVFRHTLKEETKKQRTPFFPSLSLNSFVWLFCVLKVWQRGNR